MNQRGSILLEGVLSLLVLLTVFFLGTALLLRGFGLRIEEYSRFQEERKELASSWK